MTLETSMDKEKILQYIKQTEIASIEPDAAAEIYAFELSVLEKEIPEANMRQLLLLGAAMYRNSVNVDIQNAGLQIPEDSAVAYPENSSKYLQ
jgi:hypothetical protein